MTARASAASEIERVIKHIKGDRTPWGDTGIEKPLDDKMKTPVPDRCRGICSGNESGASMGSGESDDGIGSGDAKVVEVKSWRWCGYPSANSVLM